LSPEVLVDQISQPLRDLAIGIPVQCRPGILEQSGEVGHRNRRFWVAPIAVMVKKPGSLLNTHLTTEGVFEPVFVGEIR
jgi:hypothetical protein